MLKESVKTKQPLKALREVENIRGSIMNAKSGCDFPQDRKQVHNLKYASKTIPCTSTNIPPTDVLAQVMQMCSMSGQLKLPQNQCVLCLQTSSYWT